MRAAMTQEEIAQLKESVQRTVEHIADQLIGLSDWMFEHPEIGYQEFQASERLTALLDEFGVEVKRGVAEIPTAFRATLPGAQDGPKVGIIAEYDALPEVGHGCGHNIIATSAIGASIALSRLAGKLPAVFGSSGHRLKSRQCSTRRQTRCWRRAPSEGLDAALMIHPAPRTPYVPARRSWPTGWSSSSSAILRTLRRTRTRDATPWTR